MSSSAPLNSALSVAGEDRYRLLVEAVMDYAIYLLDAGGHVSSWNKGAERFKGYSAQEILGQHFSRFYTEEDRAAGVPEQALETARREGRFEAEGWRVRKGGEKFWCSVVIDAIRDDTGGIIGYAKITRDITDRKKALDEIQAARDALQHTQKLEALGRLTGGVAHDFNNFLTTIRFAADMLQQPGVNEEKRLHLAGTIAETAERAGHLTAQLLAYARRQPLRPRCFEVQACIDGMREIFSATMGASIAIEYRYEAGPLYVCADPNQLETALLNIAVNARDAMPNGGRFVITLRREPGYPDGARRGNVEIELRDTGSGMGPEVLAKAFEPFFTTKPLNHGTGLGLSQVFGFAKQSSGDVRASSVPGQGTSLILVLPEYALDDGAMPDEPAAPAESPTMA